MLSDEDMDGTAIIQAFGSCPGPDCLKEVIPKPYGVRLRVYTAIKIRLERENKEKVKKYVYFCNGSFFY